ncbi:hypothetical protein GJ744_004124 [Endocarpon pusillum]|uniref:Uncharacterized protein n=1 Tax=Endocarpon pusillum TaxID=364733 RepID=A0A8H7AR62_9EURO|nr:hypothetical protein GJ744_004124 [Endocarpon pusillum]
MLLATSDPGIYGHDIVTAGMELSGGQVFVLNSIPKLTSRTPTICGQNPPNQLLNVDALTHPLYIQLMTTAKPEGLRLLAS